MTSLNIREIRPEEYPVLEDFLYNAIYIPLDEKFPSREVVFQPEIYIYVKDFGGKDDCGVVAEQDGKIIGAAWTRIIPAYGHIDSETPELAVSVLPEWRGKAVGNKLMEHLFELLRERGYRQTSLSVQKENPAVRFYLRLGYKIVDRFKVDKLMIDKPINPSTNQPTDYLMIKTL